MDTSESNIRPVGGPKQPNLASRGGSCFLYLLKVLFWTAVVLVVLAVVVAIIQGEFGNLVKESQQEGVAQMDTSATPNPIPLEDRITGAHCLSTPRRAAFLRDLEVFLAAAHPDVREIRIHWQRTKSTEVDNQGRNLMSFPVELDGKLVTLRLYIENQTCTVLELSNW